MDYIREFDIRLDKEMYYAGEVVQGQVILDTMENFKLRAIRVVLRGKAHAEWKVMVSGDRRTVRDDQYFIDERATIWGKDKPEGSVPILPRGHHTFPFRFQLPESSLPGSFESKSGQIRYYIKVTIDIPYASPPQGMKYFTIIGPYIDCMEEHFLKPMVGHDKKAACCLCCKRGPVSLKSQLERTAYCCGESIKFKADINNQSQEDVWLKLKLVQYVEYFIDRGVLGVNKDCQKTVLEFKGDVVPTGTRSKFDASKSLVVPVVPPTVVGVCRLIQIYYVLKVSLDSEKSGDSLSMHFPITIATVPFRIPNHPHPPQITYEVAADHVEGGNYIGPEFQLGQVYDGDMAEGAEAVLLYRPVYVSIPHTLPSGANTPSLKDKVMVNAHSGTDFGKRLLHHVIAGRKPEPLQAPPNSEVAGDARMRRAEKKAKKEMIVMQCRPEKEQEKQQQDGAEKLTVIEDEANLPVHLAGVVDENKKDEGSKEEIKTPADPSKEGDTTITTADDHHTSKSVINSRPKRNSIPQQTSGQIRPGRAKELHSVTDASTAGRDVMNTTSSTTSERRRSSTGQQPAEHKTKIPCSNVTIIGSSNTDKGSMRASNGSAVQTATNIGANDEKAEK